MPLVTRNHPKLTLEGARAVLAAAERRAQEIQRPMDIAVVDDGGHLLAFARMDGAKLSSIEISLVKARAAAVRRASTGAPPGEQPNLALALGLAIASPAQQTPVRGGVPLVVDGQVVGAIGVSAGTEDQDEDVARAGAAALEKA
ncbi:MAG TPA: heme-binding protein [Candidatus Acidoferrales bacterium]|jgi:glc operon protein GlcG|nr:heme-binding protein [Candidatus Acidoferrales bacterium]